MKRLKSFIWLSIVCSALYPCSQPMSEEIPQGEAPPSAESGVQYTKGALEGTVDPDQYTLGAGDVLEIGFWGEVNRLETVTVNPDGDILIAPVGPLHVDQMTLSEVRQLVKDKLSPYYRPNILSVSLIRIRSFQVHVVGMVGRPGALEVNAVTRASQAISLADGLGDGASERNITIRRGTELIPVDLTRYLSLGDNSVNPFLKAGDVVFVPPASGWLYVYGSVHRPGAYEFIEGETLEEVLALAGGVRPEAYLEAIEIERFDPDKPSVSEAIFVSGESAVLENFQVRLGDRIFVRAIPDWHEDAMVELRGEVKYPGVYVIDDGVERLSEVIDRAGGFTQKASLAEARLIRGSYVRSRIPVEAEIETMMEIQGSYDAKEKDLLKTISREEKGAVSVSFEKVFLDGDSRIDPLIYDGDIIEIPRASWFVRVSGQVRDPGLITFRKGEDHKYYVKEAGGFAPGADKGGTRIIRAMSGQKVKPGGEEIRPGDIIWVPARPEVNWWEITKDVLQVIAQLATVYLVVDSIASK